MRKNRCHFWNQRPKYTKTVLILEAPNCVLTSVIYRLGKLNFAPDTLSRATSASVSFSSLKSLTNLHELLCHPGITRLAHYVKAKNLPFSLSDVKNVIQACKDCSEVKASFLKPEDKMNLIKATQPFERISINFKGPLLSVSKNKYLLVIVDKFSYFPFAYACPDIKSATVIEKLGSSFMSFELKSWLRNFGVPTSRTNRCNPARNGKVERCNRTIWQTVISSAFKKTSSDSMGIRCN